MPREFRTIFRLISNGQISDNEAFNLLWAVFLAMTGYKPEEEKEREEVQITEVKGFVG